MVSDNEALGYSNNLSDSTLETIPAFCGVLKYDGKIQKHLIWGETVKDVINDCEKLKNDIEAESGKAFKLIYPLDKWEYDICTH